MKKRYLYALLFGAPGFFLSLILAFLVFGAAAGFLWAFAFGDTPWPAATETILPIVLVLTGLMLWTASTVAGFMFGKKLEAVPQLNWTHIMVSLGLTIAPMLFIVLHQLRVGNLGPQSDGQLCGELCLKEGYAASGMPAQDSGERRCLCYDDSGRVILDFPIETLAPRK